MITVVLGGGNYIGGLLRGIGSDIVVVVVVNFFIYYYLELYHHTVSQTVSLYHYITIRGRYSSDIVRPYYHNLPPVSTGLHTGRVWKCVSDSPVHAYACLAIDQEVSQKLYG